MSVVVIGVNHRTAPLELLERAAIGDARLDKALGAVASCPNVSETVVLSTCNRTELYVMAERFHGAFQDVRDSLCDLANVSPEELGDHLYVHYDEAAVRHLFRVTCGLDSAVLGENEIQGQVKQAWGCAHDQGVTGTALNTVFQHALEVGKRARTETNISRNVASVSQAAVAMAAERLGSLNGSRILVLGAGDMGEGMVASLTSSGLAELVVANRTWEKAESLAARLNGRPARLVDLGDELVSADVVLTSTGAAMLMVEHADLSAAMAARDGRPLLVVDIAVPRDVDPSASEIDGVTLLDMDDLREFAQSGIRERQREVALVHTLIDQELDRHRLFGSAREVAPLISTFRDDAEALRTAELARHAARLGDMSDADRELVEAITRGVMKKLLHEPTVRLKDAAGTARGDRLAEALRDLFDLS
ncbi:MAG: glutamyl-tRNA reductase [Acidimicrobiia bacterium]|nr:glutamyl-tRNA reductase [Acidimicrobiia bacterium]